MRGGYSPIIWGPGGVAEVIAPKGLSDGSSIVAAAGNAAGSITANVTNVDFVEVEDAAGSWNGTQFTAPVTDYYAIDGFIYVNAASTSIISAYIDTVSDRAVTGSISTAIKKVSAVIKLTAGEVLSFRSNQTETLVNTASVHYITIRRTFAQV